VSVSECPAQGSHLLSYIYPGIPVSDVSLETQAPGGWVIEGQKLVLLCSVAKGTGNITFSWHRKATENSLGNKKTQGFLSTELEIQAMKESDAGEYYCRADNGHESIQSKVVNIFVKSELISQFISARNSKTISWVPRRYK
jgi:hypothetical protein